MGLDNGVDASFYEWRRILYNTVSLSLLKKSLHDQP